MSGSTPGSNCWSFGVLLDGMMFRASRTSCCVWDQMECWKVRSLDLRLPALGRRWRPWTSLWTRVPTSCRRSGCWKGGLWTNGCRDARVWKKEITWSQGPPRSWVALSRGWSSTRTLCPWPGPCSNPFERTLGSMKKKGTFWVPITAWWALKLEGSGQSIPNEERWRRGFRSPRSPHNSGRCWDDGQCPKTRNIFATSRLGSGLLRRLWPWWLDLAPPMNSWSSRSRCWEGDGQGGSGTADRSSIFGDCWQSKSRGAGRSGGLPYNGGGIFRGEIGEEVAPPPQYGAIQEEEGGTGRTCPKCEAFSNLTGQDPWGLIGSCKRRTLHRIGECWRRPGL